MIGITMVNQDPRNEEQSLKSAEISLVISDLGSGGAQRVLTTLANAWAARGRRVCVITLADGMSDFFPLDPSIERRVAGGMHDSRSLLDALRMNFRRIANLRRCLRDSGAPVAAAFVGTTNILTILSALGTGIRVVACERNDPARQSLGRMWDFLRRRFYRYADRVTANSRGVLDTLSKFVPASKLAYVPNPLAVFPPTIEGKAHPPTVLSVGRLHFQKGYDILLPAFAIAAREKPDWRLRILGDGPLREELRKLADNLSIADRVIWEGRAADPFPFYQSSDLFVLASRFEGMPNAMLEAMACGLPVIVTDASPGPLEYVEHNVSGLVTACESVDALADPLQRLMGDPALRERLGRRARERVADCELNSVLKTWEEILQL